MVLQCKFEEIGLFIYATAILNPEGCKLAFCAWVKSTASTSRGRIWCGGEQNKTKSSEYFRETEISDEEREKMWLPCAHWVEGLEQSWKSWWEAGLCWWAASAAISIRKGQNRAGGSSGHGVPYPVLAMWFLLVKEVQQLGLSWLPDTANDRWFLEVQKARAGFTFWPRGPPLPMLPVLFSYFAVFIFLL